MRRKGFERKGERMKHLFETIKTIACILLTLLLVVVVIVSAIAAFRFHWAWVIVCVIGFAILITIFVERWDN